MLLASAYHPIERENEMKHALKVVVLVVALCSAIAMAGCDQVTFGPFTLVGPQGQQITGKVNTTVPDQGLLTIDLQSTTEGCAFNPSPVFAKKPSLNETTPFNTSVWCKNGHGDIQGQVNASGIVSMTITGWAS